MEFFKIRRVIPFMRHALVFNVISLLTFLAAVFFLVHKGLNFSIEFTGGTQIEIGYQQAADVDKVRRSLDAAGYKAEAQTFGTSREVLIRLHLEKNQSSADLSQKIVAILKSEDQSAELLCCFRTAMTFWERSALDWVFSRCMRISTSREEPKFCTSALKPARSSAWRMPSTSAACV